VLLCKEAENWILTPVFIVKVNILNGCLVDKTAVRNYISAVKSGDRKGLCGNIIIDVVEETCKVSCIPSEVTGGNLSSDFIGSWVCNFLHDIEPEDIGWGVSDLEEHAFSDFLCGVSCQSDGIVIADHKA